jgi:hypothetical protein
LEVVIKREILTPLQRIEPRTCSSSSHIKKGKVVPVLYFNSAPRLEGVLGEWRYSSTHSLTSTLYGGEWSASRPCRFTPRERVPGTHWIGGWVGPRTVLEAVKRKIPSPRRQLNPRTPFVQPVAQRYVIQNVGILIFSFFFFCTVHRMIKDFDLNGSKISKIGIMIKVT